MKTAPAHTVDTDEDLNLVEMWLRKDPKRWIAGALAGAFAALVALAFAIVVALMSGVEIWFPVKIGALPILGSDATALGLTGAIVVGLIVFELLGAFLGALYAHFAPTNSLPALLGVGFVWATFSWIFLFNLYSQSWRAVSAAQLSSGIALIVLLVFGISLTSVAFFDRVLRGRR